MSFLSPLALAAFALSLPLVLLYFLKVRRRERRVSSLMFWEAVQRDREASTFFQRLQRDPLLILQILALLALSLALAKPVATVMGEGSRKVVVVLDTSASMKARDVSPTRFDAARGEAVQLVRRLREGAEVMVLEAGVQPTVTAAMSRDRDRAVAAIRSARPHDLPTRLIEAVRTARALVGADPRAEIHVFTDGAFTLTRSPEIDDPRVHWVGVGRRSQNVGITNLSVRKGYAGSFDYQAFVSLVNYTAEAQTFDFSLEVDGRKLAEKSVTMEPSVRRSVVLPFSHNGGGSGDGAAAAQRRPRRGQHRVGGAAAAAQDRGHAGQSRQPLPREGAEDGPPGRAGREDARSVPGRHGRGRRRRAGLGDAPRRWARAGSSS